MMEFIRRGGRAAALKIARGGAGDQRRLADFTGDQRRVIHRPAADGAVNIAADEVRGFIGHLQIDTDIRPGGHKVRQQRDQHIARGRPTDGDP